MEDSQQTALFVACSRLRERAGKVNKETSTKNASNFYNLKFAVGMAN